jgi:hypothetical protein
VTEGLPPAQRRRRSGEACAFVQVMVTLSTLGLVTPGKSSSTAANAETLGKQESSALQLIPTRTPYTPTLRVYAYTLYTPVRICLVRLHALRPGVSRP